ncbi:MAG: phospholipase D family protein [Betaproteobacteria bacterium]|nr:phospholipase D family protein [Betaproteobacteria bacterium]
MRTASWCVAWALALLPGAAGAFEAAAAGPQPAVGTVELAFEPWDDAEAALRRVIAQARREIYVQAFLFTSRAIAQALIDAHRRGVRVEVLADHGMNAKGGASQIQRLAAAGIPVMLETRYASAHNKIIIADPHHAPNAVATGSFNFTLSARTRNAENVVILRNNAAVARAYYRNWLRHRADAEAPGAPYMPLH